MFRNFSTFLCLSLFCFGLAACEPNQSVKNVWKDTKSYYYEYLNTPTTLDMFDTEKYGDYLLVLGSAMSEVDEDLRQLMRVMDDSDRGVDTAWAMNILKRFPWLGGLVIIDGDGNIISRVPEYTLKEFDAAALMEEDPKQRRSSMRAYVQDNPLGPEIYLGKPVYLDDQLRAMIIAHFDIRSLLSYHRKAAELVIAAPGATLWQGIYDLDSTPLAGADWEKLVKSDVYGTLSNEHGSFYWSYSFFANLPIIYATPSAGDFPTKPEQLEALDYSSAFAVPVINVAPEPVNTPLQAPSDEQSDGMGEYLDE